MEEKILYNAHPSMFRNRPISFILCVIISAVGIGLIILLIWWLKTLGTTLTVSNERITLRKGILSKHTNEVYHTDVRNVQISQGVIQRIMDVGNVGIASAGKGVIEISVEGIRQPGEVKKIIDHHRRQQVVGGQGE